MILNIRGALGTQIFEYLLGLARAKAAGQPVEAVYINVSGGIVDPAKEDWLSRIIDVPYPVKIVKSNIKQNVWGHRDNFNLILATNVIDDVVCKVPPIQNDQVLVHVRGLDRTIADDGDYLHMMNLVGRDVKLIGDDNALIDYLIAKAGFGENVSKDAITDWAMVRGSKKVFCAFTNFTLSACIFSRHVKLNMLSLQHSHGNVKISPESYKCVELFLQKYLIRGQVI
jgi:hypothetical protein